MDVTPFAPAAMMIASGSIYAVVNAIVKGGRDTASDRPVLGSMMAARAMTALYTVIDAHGVCGAPTVAGYIVWDFVLIGGQSAIMFALLTRGAVFGAMRAQWRPGAAAGALSIITYGLALGAFALGPTAPLAALRETGMVTALVLAVVFLHEAVTPRRVTAVAGIRAGAGFILAG